MSNLWSKLKVPIMNTKSELFDSCGTHAYVFASYPCYEYLVIVRTLIFNVLAQWVRVVLMGM